MFVRAIFAHDLFTGGASLVAYGSVESDAAFTYTRRKGNAIDCGLINGTRLIYEGQKVFESLESAFFQENATQKPGYAARFRWEGNLTLD